VWCETPSEVCGEVQREDRCDLPGTGPSDAWSAMQWTGKSEVWGDVRRDVPSRMWCEVSNEAQSGKRRDVGAARVEIGGVMFVMP